MTVIDVVDRRVLGAFRCVDGASGRQLQDAMRVASRLDIRRNASGVFVVFNAPGLAALTTQFDIDPSAAWPAPSPYDVEIRPQGRLYLPRRATIRMPRKPAPLSDNASSMIPQDVVVYPGPAAVPGVNWAVVRASVRLGDSRAAAPWTVLRLVRTTDDAVLATGMSDAAGEAFLAVPGIGVSSNPNGGGAVTTATVDATLTAYFDPATLDALQTNPDWLPDPDDTLNNLANASLETRSQAVTIGRGTQSHFELPIAV